MGIEMKYVASLNLSHELNHRMQPKPIPIFFSVPSSQVECPQVTRMFGICIAIVWILEFGFHSKHIRVSLRLIYLLNQRCAVCHDRQSDTTASIIELENVI